jgi:hypothetical protein
MAGAQERESRRKLFKKFHTLPAAIEYFLTLVKFLIDDLEIFQ